MKATAGDSNVKFQKKIFLVTKFPGFCWIDPQLLTLYLLFTSFHKWSFSQMIEQLKSFNLSHKVALEAVGVENHDQITKKLRVEFEFYGQNHNFFQIFIFFSALLNELQYIKVSFYDTLEYLKTRFCPALEGLLIRTGP